MDIVTALRMEATRLEDQLSRVRVAIGAMNGISANGTRKGAMRRKAGTWHHTAATKRKLALAQKKIWAAKHKRR
jgi:hypothetical protein